MDLFNVKSLTTGKLIKGFANKQEAKGVRDECNKADGFDIIDGDKNAMPNIVVYGKDHIKFK